MAKSCPYYAGPSSGMDDLPHQVSVYVDGQRYAGQWTAVGSDEIRVHSDHGSLTVPLGRAHPDAVARRALRDMVLEQRG